MIFSISGSLANAEKISQETYVGLNIWERRHIEEWIRGNPEMLGEELLILTTEFDRFIDSNDRLDILALDRIGNLVVVELKRDRFSAYADLQAIRYAALVSSMTIHKLVPYYVAYWNKHHSERISGDDAKKQITEFVRTDSFVELSNKPRIILCSEGFSQEITTTVLWLGTWGVDISCVEIIPYKVADKIVIVPRVIIPLPEATDYISAVKEKEEAREIGKNRTSMKNLFENALIKPEEIIYLKNDLPSYVHYAANDPMFEAVITGKLGQSDGVRWRKDGSEYSISALTSKVFKELHPEQKDAGGLSGYWHWVNAEGRSLSRIWEDFQAKTTPN